MLQQVEAASGMGRADAAVLQQMGATKMMNAVVLHQVKATRKRKFVLQYLSE